MIGILLIPIFVLGNEDHRSEIQEGNELLESGISCDELNDEQLEAIGEYLMEQMHPGEQHESMNNMMTQMMGEEGMMNMMSSGMMGNNLMGIETFSLGLTDFVLRLFPFFPSNLSLHCFEQK